MKYISSRELKTSKFSCVLRTMKILMFSTHSMKYIWYSPLKSKYPLYIDSRGYASGPIRICLFIDYIIYAINVALLQIYI